MNFAMHKLISTLARLAIVLIAIVGISTPALAQLSFDLRTGDSATNTQLLTVDSNKCPNEGPTAAYVGGMITNTSGATVTDASVSLSGLNANVFLSGGQVATQYIGTMDAGQSVAVYWFVGFGCSSGASAAASVSMSSSGGTQTSALTLTIQTAISANAGGQVIGSQLGPGAVVGQTIFFDADYDFGGTGAGDRYWLQPSGAQNFNAACFRLVESEITNSNVNAAPIGAKNQLYLIQPNKQPGNNYFISVRYYFEYLCAGQSTQARPYAVQTSGTKIKYTGNYDGTGSVSIAFPGATNPFTIVKDVSQSEGVVGLTDELTYTVTITNPSVHTAILSSIVDILPDGMTFVSLALDSEVTSANSSEIPSSGDAGTLNFIGRRGQSYELIGGGSITLKYVASAPPDAGTFTNSARGVFGSATTATVTASYSQAALQPLIVTKTSSVISDPIRATNYLAIPGSMIEYTIFVSNPNPEPIDEDSVVVTDLSPPGIKFCLADIAGSGPVHFMDGPTSSELTYSFFELNSIADDLEFSIDGGASWTREPQLDGDGCDQGINAFKVNPQGFFASNSSFTLKARFRVIE